MTQFKISSAYHLDEAEQAPERPGIYVWYGRLSVGPGDWDERRNSSSDVAQNQLLKALRDHSVKHSQQPLRVDALASFTTRWLGDLEAVIPDKWNTNTEGAWIPKGDSDVARSTSSNIGRQQLLNMLDSAFPLFCSPLYIGLAIDQTLRTRLKQHRFHLRKHWDNVSKDPDYPSRLTNPAKFADRAIKVGFSPADLFFFTLHVEDDSETASGIRHEELLRSAEWLLNRWANPILGRQ